MASEHILSETESPILVQGLSRSYGAKRALDNVTLNIPKGCVFGLLGESGAGKTTLMRHLLGLMKPESGNVRVVGHDPVDEPEAVLSRVGYLSEDRDMPGWMRLRELMRYMQGFYPNWDSEYADALIERFDLNSAQKIRTLSRGQMAKTGLITALAHRPELLILDEPSSGLDVVVRRHILDAIMRTVADEGRTVLFSSHLMDEVEAISDYVAIIHKGKLVTCERLRDLLDAHRMVKVEFESDQQHGPELGGVRLWSGHGKRWSALCTDGGASVEQAASSLNFRVLETTPATLEDIFVASIADSRLEDI